MMSSVVVVNDISPVHNARYTDRVGYCGSGIFVVLETQSPVISVGGVRYIDWKSQESTFKVVVFICKFKNTEQKVISV